MEYSKFTKTQKLDMFAMRLDGSSIKEIAEKYGIKQSTVLYTLRGAIERPGDSLTRYKALNDWCECYGVATIKELADKLGCSYATAFMNLRKPSHDITFHFMLKVCALTGLTADDFRNEVTL